jgi:dTDP-4-dehydrorhamnose 3,5-epimerase
MTYKWRIANHPSTAMRDAPTIFVHFQERAYADHPHPDKGRADHRAPGLHRSARLFHGDFQPQPLLPGRYFVQDNFSHSTQRTLRGLHYQIQHPQAKLVQTFSGEVFDVAVDLRRTSPTFGKWVGVVLSGENKRQLFIPEGFAHGFCVLSPNALFSYKCSDYYDPQDEGGLLWSDPQVNIRWPVENPILSAKDRDLQPLKDLAPAQLPQTGGLR